jgi:solute carrier family 25 (mitochondrial iron transporter), member 28/37
MTLLWRNEGLRGLYRGFPVTAVFLVPAQSLYFTVYDLLKTKLLENDVNKKITTTTTTTTTATTTKTKPELKGIMTSKAAISHFASGFAAEVCSGIFWTPMEIIKQRQQVLPPNTSVKQVCSHIYKTRGFLGFFKGYFITVASFGPFSALYFTFYEQCKLVSMSIHDNNFDESKLGIFTFLISGFVAGGAAAFLTCPLDVVKTRYQVKGALSSTEFGSTTLSIFKNVIRREGWQALFKGSSARVLNMAPGTAITIAAYDLIKQFLLA